jgi:surface protein
MGVSPILVSNCLDSMFRYARSFNQPVSHFDVRRVTDMGTLMRVIWTFRCTPFLPTHIAAYMFQECFVFNQSLAGWNTSSVTSMSKSPLPIAPYYSEPSHTFQSMMYSPRNHVPLVLHLRSRSQPFRREQSDKFWCVHQRFVCGHCSGFF